MKNSPLISIVTVVYNDADGLEKTIQSVLSQTYKNIEYIVIDGGSSDGTVEVIQKYESHIDYWVSEPDKGIYDAMNKGSERATGDFVNFLNAGDFFFEETTLHKVITKIDERDKVYFGRAKIGNGTSSWLYPNDKYHGHNIEQWLINNLPNHQAMFFPKNFYKNYSYIIEYKVGADSDYKFASEHKNGFVFIDEIVTAFQLGGTSSSFSSLNTTKQILKDSWQISIKHKGLRYAIKRQIKIFVKYGLNFLLGTKTFQSLLHKWRS